MDREEIARRMTAAAASDSFGRPDEATVEAFRLHIAEVTGVPERYLSGELVGLSNQVLRASSR